MRDTIYRKDAIEAINKSFDKETLLKCFVRKMAIDAIIQVPSADRPQGEWIEVEEDWRHQIEFWKCSECDFAVSSMFNFCPNCGARMKGADDA